MRWGGIWRELSVFLSDRLLLLYEYLCLIEMFERVTAQISAI